MMCARGVGTHFTPASLPPCLRTAAEMIPLEAPRCRRSQQGQEGACLREGDISVSSFEYWW